MRVFSPKLLGGCVLLELCTRLQRFFGCTTVNLRGCILVPIVPVYFEGVLNNV
jgi:hypothetical protein